MAAAVLLLALSLLLSAAFPMFNPPAPTGDFAIGTMQNTDQLVDILDSSFFTAVDGSHCGQFNDTNYPHMGLRLATHLLTRPDSKAKHITVVDGGLIPASGGGGYDTHSNHINDSARNLKNLLTELLGRINEPGENDPNKLNLDETLVVLNMEFGRTPWPQGSTGRNHHFSKDRCDLLGGGLI